MTRVRTDKSTIINCGSLVAERHRWMDPTLPDKMIKIPALKFQASGYCPLSTAQALFKTCPVAKKSRFKKQKEYIYRGRDGRSWPVSWATCSAFHPQLHTPSMYVYPWQMKITGDTSLLWQGVSIGVWPNKCVWPYNHMCVFSVCVRALGPHPD